MHTYVNKKELTKERQEEADRREHSWLRRQKESCYKLQLNLPLHHIVRIPHRDQPLKLQISLPVIPGCGSRGHKSLYGSAA